MIIKAYGYSYPELWTHIKTDPSKPMTTQQLAEATQQKITCVRAEMYRYFNESEVGLIVRRIAFETDTGFCIKRKKIVNERGFNQNAYWAELIPSEN